MKCNAMELIKKRGHILIPQEKLPLSEEDWQNFDDVTSEDKIPYHYVTEGDTKDNHSVKVSRLLEDHTTELQKYIVDKFICEKLLPYFNQLFKKSFYCHRAQAHILSKNGFIGYHIDTDSDPDYLYAVIGVLSDSYKGGEFRCFLENTMEEVKTKKFSILLLDCKRPHSVDIVKEGSRKTVVFFLKEIKEGDFGLSVSQ